MPTAYCRACDAEYAPLVHHQYCEACRRLTHYERTMLVHLSTIGNMLTGICMRLDPDEQEDAGDDTPAWMPIH